MADVATRCLLLSDYFNFLLSGRMENEISNASTTQLLDVHGTGWSRPALDHFHLPSTWFSSPILAGTVLGPARGIPELKGVKAIAVPGHDTASAYDAMPADPAGGDLYLSAGTWSLVGFESDQPVLGNEALAARISNERTGDGRYRPLTNVIGLWLLEQTLREFDARPGHDREWAALLRAAGKLPRPSALLDVTDPALVNPVSMRAAIDAQLKKRRRPAPRTLAGYTRLICDSLGQGHADAIHAFERLANRTFRRILIVGGGAKNDLLCQATADASGLPVHAFTLEGAAVGNIASQLIGLRAVRDLRRLPGGLNSTAPANDLSSSSCAMSLSTRSLPGPGRRVQLMATCLCDAFYDDVARATVEVLEYLGCSVEFPEGQTCCGQPAFNGGDWPASRQVVRHTVRTFAGDVPVIVPSVSCTAMLAHGAPLEFEKEKDRPDVDAFSRRAWEIIDFIVHGLDCKTWPGHYPARIAFHRSCHSRGTGSGDAVETLLRSLAGVTLVPF